MHARYYTFNLGRFMSVDPVGGEVGSSQSWNRYAYVRGNPVNAVDPLGLYETKCGDDEDCQANAEAFEKARQANLKRGGDIGKTAEAYGKPGEDNGITVTFGEVEPGARANVKADIKANSEGTAFELTATVTINPALKGTQLEAAVGHEGQHLVDAEAFAATFSMKGAGSWDLSKNLTVQQTETNAYHITHAILASANQPMGFLGRGGPVTLGKHNMSGAKVNHAIERILQGPLYKGKLKDLQFPLWNFAP